MQHAQTPTKPRALGHHPRTTTNPDKVVKLGFPVRHAERIAVQKMAAAHDLSVKDLLLQGAALLHAGLERESDHGATS